MTKPIQLYLGDGDSNAWYINGELVVENMTQNTFMYKFLDVHRDKSHIDPATGLTVTTVSEANRIAKAARLDSYRRQLKDSNDRVAYLQLMINDLENS